MILSTGTPLPAQWTCGRRRRYEVMAVHLDARVRHALGPGRYGTLGMAYQLWHMSYGTLVMAYWL